MTTHQPTVELDRRAAIGLLSGSIVAFLTGGVAAAETPAAACPIQLPEAIRPLGEAWLFAHPDESIERLSSALFGQPEPPEALDRSALRSKIRADYAAGRMTLVARWYISETEAHLCAFAALAGCIAPS